MEAAVVEDSVVLNTMPSVIAYLLVSAAGNKTFYPSFNLCNIYLILGFYIIKYLNFSFSGHGGGGGYGGGGGHGGGFSGYHKKK